MDLERLTSKSEFCPALPNQAPLTNRLRYIDPAPMMDVMVEQLKYLVSHEGRICEPDCADCIRFRKVASWLLQPFRATDASRQSMRLASSRSRRVKKTAQQPESVRALRTAAAKATGKRSKPKLG